MPPAWVLQQCPDDGSAGSRFVLAFWFVCLPLYWIYLSLVIAPISLAGVGQAIGLVMSWILILAAILAGIVCLGVLLMLLLALAATLAAIRQARPSSD